MPCQTRSSNSNKAIQLNGHFIHCNQKRSLLLKSAEKVKVMPSSHTPARGLYHEVASSAAKDNKSKPRLSQSLGPH